MSYRNCRLAAAVALLAGLASAPAGAEDIAIEGHFEPDGAWGVLGEFAALVGHENGWRILMRDVAIVREEGPAEIPPGEKHTTLVPASFDFWFFGPDAELLNARISARIAYGGAGPSTRGPITFIARDGGADAFFYVLPEDTERYSYFDSRFEVTSPPLTFDDDGYVVLAPFTTTLRYSILFDRTGGGLGNVIDENGGGAIAFGPYVEQVTELEPDATCRYGGEVWSTGIDLDDDGGPDVIFDHSVECNGRPGESCTVVDNEDGTFTMTCPDGTSVTFSDGADGEDGAAGQNGAAGADGAAGQDGAPGADGADGGPCTVTEVGGGTYTIACPDGTTVTLRDGADGADGGCASAGSRSRPSAAILAVLLASMVWRRRPRPV